MSEHGTRTRYVAGCRCEECRAAARQYERDLREAKKHGYDPLVDAEPVRAHLLNLMGSQRGAKDGMGYHRISRAAGVPLDTVNCILYAKAPRKRREKVRKSTARKLLAVTPEPAKEVEAASTQRMIREMRVWGVSDYKLKKALGGLKPERVLGQKRVWRSTRERVSKLHWAVYANFPEVRYSCNCTMPPEVARRMRQEDVA